MSMRGATRWTMVACLAWALAAALASCGTRQAQESASGQAAAPDSAPPDPRLLRGQQAYLASCAMCHGEWGEGDGPMAAGMRQGAAASPTALNDPVRLGTLERAEVVRVITLGGGKTHRSNLMPPWRERLSRETIGEIADYVMALPTFKPGVPRATVEKYLEAPPGSAAEGRKLFVFYCTMCHGPYGRGDGLMADTLWARHQVRPRNLTDSLYFAGQSDRDLFVTVSLGGSYSRHSTYMPGWSATLTPEQIRHLVSYLRTISRTAPRP